MKKSLVCIAAISLVACSGSDTGIISATDDNDQASENMAEGEGSGDGEGTGEGEGSGEGGGDSGSPSSALTATYRVTFNASWSEATHPLDFPSDPHFSGLVGAVHNEQVQFWNTGQLATDGIELMAETGDKAILLSEVDTAIANGYAGSAISGGGISTSPGSVSVEFTVSQTYPEITLVTMVAPSPDWFVGIHNYSLLENGDFINSRTVELAVYDAGTDGGLRYTSGDIDSDEPIALLTSQPEDSPFQQGLPVVGQFVIEKL